MNTRPSDKKPCRASFMLRASALVCLLALAGCASSEAASSTPTTSPTKTSGAATTTVAKSPSWQTIQTFKGNGEKKTAVFAAPDTWQIKYTCQGQGGGNDGLLAVSVYGSDATIKDQAVDATCKDGKVTTDSTIEHEGGQVYLDIDGTGDWVVEVLAQK